VRPESKTYGDWVAARLEPESGIALYIPEGFAHGWQALEDRSAIEYLVEGYWDRASERGVSPLNRRVDIQWPLKPTDILDRDLSWPALS
jgi:dTDP-4-dehydrorhamnose 3,5-epimerase